MKFDLSFSARLAVFSANQDISGFPFDFKTLKYFLTSFNNHNQNQNILHQIYTKVKMPIRKIVPAVENKFYI